MRTPTILINLGRELVHAKVLKKSVMVMMGKVSSPGEYYYLFDYKFDGDTYEIHYRIDEYIATIKRRGKKREVV
ncbi:hypothetical protein [Paenibacillus sp. MER 99-2]|uniref:hypothetical protein n=1 Tax=Paenibacillus sp. MER 99-2 TaxID=2939572 RepID=UPI00203D759A|nr:hypothetical protein [Paenibacillus sp. MER 99-2]MCM3176238.1 hypothetical protein [Paenibacillus sp. MER 99-2]